MAQKKPGQYPIQAASRLTRLSVDTLRAWERRYGVVRPHRRNGVRFYTDADIERLSMLRDALDHGHTIGNAAAMTPAELKKAVSTPKPASAVQARARSTAISREDALSPIVAAIERFSYIGAERELVRLATLMSPRQVVHQVALPLMRLAGRRWHDQRMRVAQEHMLTELLGSLLGTLIRMYASENPPATVLCSTLSNDLHSFGVLAGSMLAAGAGLGVVYLGANLPGDEISYAAKRTRCDAVLVSVTHPEDVEQKAAEIAALRSRISAKTELWIALNPPDLELDMPRTAIPVRSFEMLERELVRVGGRF